MTKLKEKEVIALSNLVWGENVSEQVFNRWCQGFTWSKDEKCALIQQYGGPCAIIAPVQAYLLKNILFKTRDNESELPETTNVNLKTITDAEKSKYFHQTLLEILKRTNPNRWFIFEVVENTSTGPSHVEHLENTQTDKTPSFKDFHQSLSFVECFQLEELESVLSKNLSKYQSSNTGVLLFLYSIILSKGIDVISNEMDNPELPLIDSTYGHASQNLTNLLLSGEAVSNVFDGECDIGGLKLKGISAQCPIGFLTLLEKLRYCTVGDRLKKPLYPIWLLGSETHLSVVFSTTPQLVCPESALENAHKVFDKYDPEDGGFISSAVLENILNELGLESDSKYVKIMCENLDPEDLGIIVRSKFFNEFFSEETKSSLPDSFEIFHYNGLCQSSTDKCVRFRKGVAKEVDWQENCGRVSDSQVESCLKLRWPGLWVTWEGGKAPSLN